MASLAFSRSGSGPSLVLLPGIGFSRIAWNPVVPALARQFDVVAVDLPGFGDSAHLPPGTEASPARLASAVAVLLDELGIRRPHVVGNSLGGWVALELAAARPVASLTLLSPAGLWRRDTRSGSLRLSRWLCRHAAAPVPQPRPAASRHADRGTTRLRPRPQVRRPGGVVALVAASTARAVPGQPLTT